MADADDLQRAMADAIASAIAQHEPSITTKWVVLAETIDDQGVRGLWPLASEEATSWDIKGMLTEALDMETAKTLADRLQ